VSLIIDNYKQTFGEENTAIIEKATSELFPADPDLVPEYLPIIDGIINNVVSKLNLFGAGNVDNRYKPLGIYKFTSRATSDWLQAYIKTYREKSAGLAKSRDMEQLTPFVWFYLGSELSVPTTLAAKIATLSKLKTDSDEVTAKVKVFTDFLKGKEKGEDSKTEFESVFMIVHYCFPPEENTASADILCRLHKYDESPTPIDEWNEWADTLDNKKLGVTPPAIPTGVFASVNIPAALKTAVKGLTMGDIGMSATNIPNFNIQQHVSLPALQFSTLLAVKKQVE